jgi:polysaccharide pyruvyl transferase WcaK-like protein
MEGVGLGPLKNSYNRFIAKHLFKLADQVVLRAEEKDPILKGINYVLKRDPAFDYLETRSELSVSEEEGKRIQDVFPIDESEKVIGINLRPLWKKYMGNEDRQIAERVFLQKFSDALQTFYSTFSQRLRFVFFSMNSDQLGFSDLHVAYQLTDYLPDSIPFHIWETEPDVDAVLFLLRNMDACISMRLHASIFSISQSIPTIGIDYSFPGPGKVSKLFDTLGISDFVCTVGNFSPDWLVDRLNKSIATTSRRNSLV